MHLGSLVQPYMSVDSGSFVEPSLFQSGVHAYAYDVFISVIQVFRYVIDLCRISARLMSEIEAVHPYAGIAENAVELQPEMFSIIFDRNGECLSVPSYAGLWIFVSYGLVAVAMACFSGKRQVHHPVMRQVHFLPL